MDCSTSSFITKEVADNAARSCQHGLPLDATEVVTGEHSASRTPGQAFSEGAVQAFPRYPSNVY